MTNKDVVYTSKQTKGEVSYPLFKKKNKFSSYGHILMQDFCMDFSISLSKTRHRKNFYIINSKDGRFDELITCKERYDFDYYFDKILSRNMSDLIKYGKAYIEVVKLYDKDRNLVGIDFIPFKNSIQISLMNKIFFLNKRYDNKLEVGTMEAKNVIKIHIKEIGFSRLFFRRLFRKLTKIGVPDIELITDNNSGFDYKKYEKKQDFNLLKIGRPIYWLGRKFDNYYINEPYLVYLRMQEIELKENLLNKLLGKYNKKLTLMGKEYGFNGYISFQSRTSDFEKLYMELCSGEKNCEDVSNWLYN